MNIDLLNDAVQEFLTANLKTDALSLLFKNQVFKNVTQKELTQQLIGKQKAASKLPTWFKTKGIYYPEKLNLEQTSSEATAQFKASLVSGDSMLDLTGGFGVDSFYFSKKVTQLTHIETNTELSNIAAHNFKQLEADNISCVNEEAISFLKNNNQHYDWIYLDPSRRNTKKGKVFLLEDYQPNIIELLPLLYAKTENILLKTSPLLDITLGVDTLKNVKQVYVVAVDNEVKELLWHLQKDYDKDYKTHAINIKKQTTETLTFDQNTEEHLSVAYSHPKMYLYEPNAALLKAAAFNMVANTYKLSKIAPFSHLYTSDTLVSFPGRTFVVKHCFDYHKKAMKQLGIKKANITTRNFGLSVSEIRKIHKISDGGDLYLFLQKQLKTNR